MLAACLTHTIGRKVVLLISYYLYLGNLISVKLSVPVCFRQLFSRKLLTTSHTSEDSFFTSQLIRIHPFLNKIYRSKRKFSLLMEHRKSMDLYLMCLLKSYVLELKSRALKMATESMPFSFWNLICTGWMPSDFLPRSNCLQLKFQVTSKELLHRFPLETWYETQHRSLSSRGSQELIFKILSARSRISGVMTCESSNIFKVGFDRNDVIKKQQNWKKVLKFQQVKRNSKSWFNERYEYTFIFVYDPSVIYTGCWRCSTIETSSVTSSPSLSNIFEVRR